MMNSPQLPGWKDRILFTPGPLTTSQSVKQAMLRDWGSRDASFIALVKDVRKRLVELGDVSTNDYTAVLMQGSGTFGVEAVFSSAVSPSGKVLIVTNGAYGKRLTQIASVLKISTQIIEYPEDQVLLPADIDRALAADPALEMVALVHCETTTGMFNPVAEIGQIVARHRRRYFVDAMSSFGAVPLHLANAHIDYLVSSANKCIEGVPGFSFVISKLASLKQTEGWARSLCLDLHAQWKGLEASGQFRFTPPTHALLAFHQALLELQQEGGPQARARRYQENHAILRQGMRDLGFVEYLPSEKQGSIITSFRSTTHPRYDFEAFYTKLSDRGYVIYPGKVSNADCFRIGHIGRVFPSDVHDLLAAIKDVLAQMKIDLDTKS